MIDSTAHRALPRSGRVSLLALMFVLACGTGGCEQLIELIDSISDGAECSSNSQCLGGVCLSDFPDGYCSTDQCDTQGCSNIFGSECLLLPSNASPLCYEDCDDDTECRPGYACFAVETERVCLPSSFDQELAAAGDLGSACGVNQDCDSGTCLTNLVGGYCSLLDCAADADCGSGGRCFALEADPGTGEGSGEAGQSAATACFAGCTNDASCRFGYACTDVDGGGGACIPSEADNRSPVRNPSGADDGQPCTVDINCKGGTCLREAEGYPGGYCTTLDCASVGCNSSATGTADCWVVAEETACFVSCTADGECRGGYGCIGGASGDGYCAPRTDGAAPTTGGTEEIVVNCESTAVGGGRALTFDIAADTQAFAVVPFSQTSNVRPSRLLLPDGSVGPNFDVDYAFLDVDPFLLEFIAPVFFPAAPQFDYVTEQGGGTYTLEVQTSDPEVCFYVLEKPAAGARIAVNVYFVGTTGLNAGNARSHSGFSAMMSSFERIYSGAGIELDELRLVDAASDVAERFQVIRDFNDLSRLVATGVDPGPSLEELLSIDVFLIDGFAVPQAPGLLGASMGIPGVPGVHGSLGTGLVFTAEYLGSSASQVGQTMAHEIGHFNGLRHTSEHGGSEWDPLSDTSECSNPERGAACPDADNLMFPFSLGTNQEGVSAGQAAVLRASPHVR